MVPSGERSENDFAAEQSVRLAVLDVLYTQRRAHPYGPGIFMGDFEQLIGRPCEQVDFAVWSLLQKGFVQRSDHSRLAITAEGADHLEASLRRLREQKPSSNQPNASAA